MKVIISCEHAYPYVPAEFKNILPDNSPVLKTHEAFDPGAFDLFKALKHLADFSSYQKISRLLIETNRSQHHRSLFSRYSKQLSDEKKKELLINYYDPYRNSIEKEISDSINQKNKVLHLSVHSFTPVLNGEERNCDIGLLFDPKKDLEKKFVQEFKLKILKESDTLHLRFNYPYLGIADGFTTYLRKKFPENYLGIELEVNQKFVQNNNLQPSIKNIIVSAFENYLSN